MNTGNNKREEDIQAFGIALEICQKHSSATVDLGKKHTQDVLRFVILGLH